MLALYDRYKGVSDLYINVNIYVYIYIYETTENFNQPSELNVVGHLGGTYIYISMASLQPAPDSFMFLLRGIQPYTASQHAGAFLADKKPAILPSYLDDGSIHILRFFHVTVYADERDRSYKNSMKQDGSESIYFG
jgi:hypothetical protein